MNTRFYESKFSSFFKLTISVSILSMIVGCAIPHSRESHSFEFHMMRDNQTAEVLDFWYGKNQEKVTVRMAPWLIKEGKPSQGEATVGVLERGDFLYVKWRDKKTNKIYSDKVDLRNRLGENITNRTIYFMIEGPQLYIYLIFNNIDSGPSDISTGPRVYRSEKKLQIYPD